MGQTRLYNSAGRKVRTNYVTSIISVSLVMFLFGLVGWLLINAHQLSIYIKENLDLTIEIADEASESEIFFIRKQLDASSYIKETQYISKEEAEEILKKDLSEDFTVFLGKDNPLPAIIECKLHAPYANIDSIQKIEKKLSEIEHIRHVTYQKSLITLVNRNISKITAILLLFSGLLFIMSLTLINNSVRSAVYARRFLIHTMKLVGATPHFIRQPFLLVSFRNGMFSGIVAIGLLVGLYSILRKEMGQELMQFFSVTPSILLFAGLLILSVFISFFVTYFAVTKYIDMHKDQLYR